MTHTTLAELLAPIEGDIWPEIPDVTDDESIVSLHTQLLEMAASGSEYVTAAKIVSELFWAARAAISNRAQSLVPIVVRHVIDGLRVDPLGDVARITRFDVADGWLAHLLMVNGMDQDAAELADAATGSPPFLTTEEVRQLVAGRLARIADQGYSTATVALFSDLVRSGMRSRGWFRKELLRLIDAGRLTDEGGGQFGIVRREGSA